MSSSSFPFAGVLLAAGLAAAAVQAACTGPGPDVARASASASNGEEAGPAFDPCEGDKPPWRTYTGPLKAARCEQDMFLKMAAIGEDLGVKCGFCHVPKADNPKSFEYPLMTPNKEVALWMSHTFMSGLARKDGQPMTCGSCHVDKKGKPSAKFLGTPRDKAWALEWMTTVMTNRFTLADGSKLRCKNCHVGTWGTPTFVANVIGKTDQVPHGALPDSVVPPPAPTADPSATPPASSAAPSASASSSASASAAPRPQPWVKPSATATAKPSASAPGSSAPTSTSRP